MACGNMLLGYSRGSIGDVTFSRVKGQQVQKARNRNPSNPRTPTQMWQRAALASAVAFYTQTTAGLFKFAFEDRGAHESDYNSFMRHNMRRSLPMPRGWSANKAMTFAPWLMSQGSLPSVTVSWTDDENAMWEDIVLQQGDILSSMQGKDLYRIVKRNLPWLQDGDILTFLVYYQNSSDITQNYPYVATDNPSALICRVSQVVLDSASTEVVPAAFQISKGLQADRYAELQVESIDDNDSCACCLIISRNSAQGLQVSTQELYCTAGLRDAYMELTEGDIYAQQWRDRIMRSWDAGTEAILQGSLSK